jgi:hypothetical protein
MVKGRPSYVESNGAGQERRQENRQGLEALTRCNKRDGSQARDILEYARINRENVEHASGLKIHPVADFSAEPLAGIISPFDLQALIRFNSKDISDTRLWSVLTAAPVATADATDTLPRRAGIAAQPFWYDVLQSARAIVFGWCVATALGIAILPRRATVRYRP